VASGNNLQTFAALVHGLELALHLLCALLIYLLAALLARRGRAPSPLAARVSPDRVDLAAAAGALFFLLHPVSGQVVSFATCTKQVIPLVLALAAVFPAALSLESGRTWPLVAATALSVAAMLANPSMVVWPVCLCLLGPFAFASVSGRRVRALAACTLVPALAVTAIGLASRPTILEIDLRVPPPFHRPNEGGHPIPALSPLLRPVRALDDLGFYARRTVLPYPLALDYWRLFAEKKNQVLIWLEAALGAAVLALVWRQLRRRVSDASFELGLAWALLLVAPALGFLSVSENVLSDVTDRYMYSWLAGIALVVSAAARQLERRLLIAAMASLGVVFLAATLVHQPVWRSDEALMEDVIAKEPDLWQGYAILGELHMHARRYEDAYQLFRRSWELYEGYFAARKSYPVLAADGVLMDYAESLGATGRVRELQELAHHVAFNMPGEIVDRVAMANILRVKGYTRLPRAAPSHR
jgi:hypothetical protein